MQWLFYKHVFSSMQHFTTIGQNKTLQNFYNFQQLYKTYNISQHFYTTLHNLKQTDTLHMFNSIHTQQHCAAVYKGFRNFLQTKICSNIYKNIHIYTKLYTSIRNHTQVYSLYNNCSKL